MKGFLAAILLSFVVIASGTLPLFLDGFLPYIIAPVVILLSVFVVFRLFKKDEPRGLTAVDKKPFWQSKIFWLAFLNLISAISMGLFDFTIDPEVQEEIVNLDWTNIIQALISVFIIVIRKYDILI